MTARAYATVTGPTATYTGTDGHREPIEPAGAEDIRHAVVRRATDEARRTGTPLELITSGDRGDHHLLITADGALTPVTAEAPLRSRRHTDAETPEPREPAAVDQAMSEIPEVPDFRRPEASGGTGPEESAQEPKSAAEGEPAAPRASFITAPDAATPTVTGWRAWVSRVGIAVPASAADRRRAEQEAVASRHWAGCRTIAVANGKGGVGKTLTTAMLAAVYGRLGGGNVLAWDNNDTRGTLGWRTEHGEYDTTIRDLLPATTDLLSTEASVSDISRFVHHQAADRYDVLRSNPELLATDQRISTDDFRTLMRVAARYYRLVVFDSGNDESADRWLSMIDAAHQLVIPTLTAPESAESAALLLDALRDRDEHSARLAEQAVVIVTQSEPSTTRELRGIAAGFEHRVRAVHTVPFDPSLKAGPLRFEGLRPRTADAWLAAAASTASGL